jgi:aryl-alcohol dehydrogenase-like predicted oxidoreductase
VRLRNSPESLRAQVHDNLRRLGLDVVNLRTLAGIHDRATVPGELAVCPDLTATRHGQARRVLGAVGSSGQSLGRRA